MLARDMARYYITPVCYSTCNFDFMPLEKFLDNCYTRHQLLAIKVPLKQIAFRRRRVVAVSPPHPRHVIATSFIMDAVSQQRRDNTVIRILYTAVISH